MVIQAYLDLINTTPLPALTQKSLPVGLIADEISQCQCIDSRVYNKDKQKK